MRRLRVAVVVALGVLVASAAFAQQGSINGTAVDATRAVLPGVNITATDQEAGRQITAVTNEKGEYLLANLPPGKYTIPFAPRRMASQICPRTSSLVGWRPRSPLTVSASEPSP